MLFDFLMNQYINHSGSGRAVKGYKRIPQGEFVLPINSKRIKLLNYFLDIHAQLAYKV